MKKPFLTAMVLSGGMILHAQHWDVHIGGGLSYGKPFPGAGSTKTTSFFNYGFTKPGMYFSPELFLVVNEHNQFSFGYQYSDNNIGIKFRDGSGGHGYVYDILDMHSFSVGYQYNHLLLHKSINVKAFAKMGLAYGNPIGYGIGSSSGGGSGPASYISYIKLNGEHLNAMWTPCSTVGIGLGPNRKDRWPKDRLSLHISATICWKDPYDDYSTFEYVAYENNNPVWGTIKYQGLPLLLQAGIDYNLIRFHKE